MRLSWQRYGLLVRLAHWKVWLRWPYLNGHDLWVGCYWKHDTDTEMTKWTRTFYLCLLPTVVLQLSVMREFTNAELGIGNAD